MSNLTEITAHLLAGSFCGGLVFGLITIICNEFKIVRRHT